ncbi:MAG: T9SS type A sorting domain-containing protein [bacterium]|nr:T9SS type A sorting domain-containing protein [bacterium]
MKKHINTIIFTCFCFVTLNISYGRTVSFSRVTVDSAQNGPHGMWAGNVDGTSPQYEQDILATIGSAGKAVWYGNNGLGISWSTQNSIWSGGLNYEIAAAELDGNGTLDAVSCNITGLSASGKSSLVLHKNNGSGSFATTTIDGPLEGAHRQLRLRDINGDGKIDLIATVCSQYSLFVQADPGLYWYKNSGTATFTKYQVGQCNPWKVDCFDDRGDGHLDIVVSEFYHGYTASGTSAACRLVLYKNDGAENFSEVIIDNSFPYGDNIGGSGVRCYDFDKDGKTDIVCGDISGAKLYWYKNGGGGSFTRNTIATNCTGIDGIDIGDFNTDGNMDMVVAGRSYWLRWYEGDGIGNFTSHAIDATYQLFDLPYVSYFDGDTCPDIVVTEATSSTGRIFAYLNPCVGGSVEENTKTKTSTLAIKPNIVNQNSNIKIQFSVPDIAPVSLSIYDVTGKAIKTLINEYRTTGCYETNINAKNIPNGIYFVKLRAGNCQNIQKLIIVK